jgi:hypothetical protein
MKESSPVVYFDTDIGMGNAIKELENYLKAVDRRLSSIDEGLKKQTDDVISSIQEAIVSEYNLI